jgi:hypothetical protein
MRVLPCNKEGVNAGFFFGLLADEETEKAIKLCWANGDILTISPGNATRRAHLFHTLVLIFLSIFLGGIS